MKFFAFYEDLINEARYYSDEKFNWVASNIGDWIFDSVVQTPALIKSLPLKSKFEEYVSSSSSKPITKNEDLILSMSFMESFLNSLSQGEAQKFVKESMERYPLVKSKISNYLKRDIDLTVQKRRGRPPGVKNKPKIDLSDPSIKIIRRIKPEQPQEPVQPIQSVPTPEPIEPETTALIQKFKGRPKKYDDQLSPFERAKFRKEGPGMIKSLEGKIESLNHQAEEIRQRVLKIMNDIDKRKKFFGKE